MTDNSQPNKTASPLKRPGIGCAPRPYWSNGKVDDKWIPNVALFIKDVCDPKWEFIKDGQPNILGNESMRQLLGGDKYEERGICNHPEYYKSLLFQLMDIRHHLSDKANDIIEPIAMGMIKQFKKWLPEVHNELIQKLRSTKKQEHITASPSDTSSKPTNSA